MPIAFTQLAFSFLESIMETLEQSVTVERRRQQHDVNDIIREF